MSNLATATKQLVTGEQMSGLFLHHLLRTYASASQKVVSFRGGMAPRSLRQVLNYIEEHLHEDLKPKSLL